MSPVLRAAWAAARRRRLQSLILGTVVLLSAATAVLAAGLVVASRAPFDQALGRQSGAHAAASFSAPDGLAGTATRPGVSGAAGPFAVVEAGLSKDGPIGAPGPVVGRDSAATAVDRLDVVAGSWLTGPGQIVLPRGSGPAAAEVGDRITVDVPGSPVLRVVGLASSVTGTATAWVWPSESFLSAASSWQMLYRFAAAGDEAAVRASLATATDGLPYLGSTSYLAVRTRLEGVLSAMVPFVVAFAVLGLVLSVLIVVNVVAGAVVAGFRTIGVQKSLGFTPAQITGVYAGQILIVCGPAALLGVLAGHLASIPLLAQTNEAYTVSAIPSMPLGVDAVVLAGVTALAALAAAGPALRAGRLSAVQAITVGRAPRTGRGAGLRRMLAATTLPRPVGFGLGTAFARPTRAAVTVVAVLLGVATVVFATGLSASLTRIADAGSRLSAVPVRVALPGVTEGRPGPGGSASTRPGPGGSASTRPGPGGSAEGTPAPAGARPGGRAPRAAADPAVVRGIIAAQPGTAHVTESGETEVSLAGYTEPLTVRTYDGDASWAGYPVLAGRWYTGPGEAVAGSRMLRLTGAAIGDTLTIGTGAGQRRVTLVGEVFSNGSGATMVMDASGLDGASGIRDFEIGLTAGTDPVAYTESLRGALGDLQAFPEVSAESQENEVVAVMIALIVTLTVLLTAVAALGVFNTVVLNTRERVHEIGVLKSIGMTPGQVRVMVVSSVTLIGLLGGVLAVPLGWALHAWALPAMADGAGLVLPGAIVEVWNPLVLAALAGAGVVLAVLGALVPGTWASRTRAATALRAE